MGPRCFHYKTNAHEDCFQLAVDSCNQNMTYDEEWLTDRANVLGGEDCVKRDWRDWEEVENKSEGWGVETAVKRDQ